MTIQFTMHDEESLDLKTDNGVKVIAYMDDNDCELISLDDDYGHPPADDTCNGLYLYIDKQFVSLTAVIRAAEEQYPSLLAEYKQEEADELYMQQELSSPYLTGRV